MDPIKLSVLVCGIAERIPWGDETHGHVLYELDEQVRDRPVELLYLLDNRHMTVGRKRNILLAIAQGEWVAFVDDDDEVAGNYVDTLLAAIELAGDAGVIVFKQDCHHVDTNEVEHCEYGLGYEYGRKLMAGNGRCIHCGNVSLMQYNGGCVNPGHLSRTSPCGPKQWAWTGKPAHTMCWRTELVQDVEFPEGSFGEDVGWVARACERVKAEYRLEDTLYTYRYDPAKSRTRGL